jgi:hypothetical protein
MADAFKEKAAIALAALQVQRHLCACLIACFMLPAHLNYVLHFAAKKRPRIS